MSEQAAKQEDHGSLRADMRAAFRDIHKLVLEVKDMREMQVTAIAEQAKITAQIGHLTERLGATEQLAVRVLTLEHREQQRGRTEEQEERRREADRQARQKTLYSVVGSVLVSVVSFLGMLVVAGWMVMGKGGG